MTVRFDEETHTYWLGDERLLSVTGILKSAGIVDTSRFDDAAAARGTAVHAAIEYLVQGDLNRSSLDPEIIPYVDGFERFLEESGFVPLQQERTVCNEALGYAGRLDHIGTLGRLKCIIDVKTGSLPNWTGLQLAGYDLCLERRHARFALNLRADSGYTLKRYKLMKEYKIFKAAAQVARWKKAS